MSLWKAILAFFAPRPRNSRRSWDPITNPFDADRVAKKHRLEEQGRDLGKVGVPLETDALLSGPERNALLAVEQAKTDYVAAYQQRLKALQAQASRLDPAPKLAKARGSAEQFEREANNLLTENKVQLQRLADLARSRRDALERFREKHQRIDLPDYPSKQKVRFLWAVAAAVVVLETFFNATFFSKGLGGGLREGMVEAFIFSAGNVSIAVLAGIHVLRFNNHNHAGARFLSRSVFILFISWATCLALYVAHYRDALHLTVEDAGSTAWRSLLSSPLSLTGPSSWALFFVGFFAACFGVWKGYKLNDPYPFYGATHRKAEESAKSYDRAVQKLRGELAKYRQTRIEHMENIQEMLQSNIVELKSVIDNKKRLGDEMFNEMRTLQAALGALVETFRAANKVGREGKPVPAYFNTTPALESRELPDFSTADDEATLARQQAAASAFIEQKIKLSAQIESAFNDQYSSLLTVNELFDPAQHLQHLPTTSPVQSATVTLEPITGVPSAAVVPLRSAERGASA